MCPNFHAKSGMTLQSISLYHRSRDMKTTSFHFYTKHRSLIVPLEGTNCPLHRRKLGTNRPLPGHIWSLYFPAKPYAARLPEAESNRKHLYIKQAKQGAVIHSRLLACLFLSLALSSYPRNTMLTSMRCAPAQLSFLRRYLLPHRCSPL